MTMQESISAAFAAVGGDIKALQGGVIVDSGQNEHGRWVRWGDGTQMCQSKQIAVPIAQPIPAGGVRFLSQAGNAPVWTFPKRFKKLYELPVTVHTHLHSFEAVGYCTGVMEEHSGGGQYWEIARGNLAVRNLKATALTGQLIFSATAWGRWK